MNEIRYVRRQSISMTFGSIERSRDYDKNRYSIHARDQRLGDDYVDESEVNFYINYLLK